MKPSSRQAIDSVHGEVKFYHVSRGCGEYVEVGEPIGVSHLDYWEIVTGRRIPNSRLCFEVPKGIVRSRLGHVLSSGAWSDEMIGVLRSVSATGFSTHSIKVFLAGKEIRGYHGVSITGRGGAFDPTRSGVTRWSKIPGKPMYHKAVFMDKSGWDGSDIFFMEHFGSWIFASERAVNGLLTLPDLKDLRIRPNNIASVP